MFFYRFSGTSDVKRNPRAPDIRLRVPARLVNRREIASDAQPVNEPSFRFYYYFENIFSIRQIDHAFIPLSFHWSAQQLSPGFCFKFLIVG